MSKEEFVASKPGASEETNECAKLTSPAGCKVALFRNERRAGSVVNGAMPNLRGQARGEVRAVYRLASNAATSRPSTRG